MLNKLYDYLIYFLAIPLMVFFALIDIYENVLMLSYNQRDRLTMKKLNLLDAKHVHDFMEWNESYKENRNG